MADAATSKLLLAFDTSTTRASVAVGRGAEVLARAFIDRPGAHASLLLPRIEEVLDRAGVAPGELEGLVVGAGPGSFTGVRVAAATAKGLARGLGVPLWAFSSLAAAAASAGATVPEEWQHAPGGDRAGAAPAGRPLYVLFDARGERVYAACLRYAPPVLESLVVPGASTVGAVLEGHVPDGALFAGDGALRHAEAIRRAGHGIQPPPAGIPTAEGLLRLADLEPERAPEDPGSWEPRYMRAWQSGAGAKPVPTTPPRDSDRR